jgi:nicotinate-nucleotide pyrophosphorylase (carboxylating)
MGKGRSEAPFENGPTMPHAPFPPLLIDTLVRATLAEDLGRAGDITTDALIPADSHSQAVIVARKAGCIAGLDFAKAAFTLQDANVRITFRQQDGDMVAAQTVLADLSGPTRALLTAERTALNFLTHLSGIATATRQLVDAVSGTKAKIACTRKTLPLLRAAEKYAVRAGGGSNHRFGLDDAILIKDNHIAAVGSMAESIARARAHVGHLVKIEAEADRLDQVEAALTAGADVIMLDNMTPDQMRAAVALIAGRAVVEASGGITPASVRAVAETGVDIISTGWITHSAPALDIALDFLDS